MTDDVDVDGESPSEPDGTPGEDAAEIDFEDLSLPQRVFVAAVQNPTRGVVITALFAFAFSFYIAFWLEFPRVAALFTALAAVVTLVALGVYYLIDRVF